jgi:hypothetical protein
VTSYTINIVGGAETSDRSAPFLTAKRDAECEQGERSANHRRRSAALLRSSNCLLLSACLARLLLVFQNRSADLTPGVSRFHEIKQFVASPPAIEDARFIYVGPDVLTIKDRTVTTNAAHPIYLRAQWSPEYFYILQAQSVEDLNVEPLVPDFNLKANFLLVGKDATYWILNAEQKTVVQSQASGVSSWDSSNPVLLLCNTLSRFK